MIKTENLTKQFKTTLAVDQLNLEVREGEVFGFLGPNGAGKTTTVRLLTSLIVPTSGTAVVNGCVLGTDDTQIRRTVGILTETPGMYDNLNADYNLRMFASLYEVKDIPGQVEKYLRMLGLWERRFDEVGTFSKGMKQKLAIARALMHEPRILFLDEPTDGLDPVSSQTIHAIIREAAERGCAVFLTTHDMTEADKLSHRVAFINQGKIAALDRPAVLKQRFGKRSLNVEMVGDEGQTQTHNIALDDGNVSLELQRVFASGKVLTAHTEEATLEDIFIQMTGRGLLA